MEIIDNSEVLFIGDLWKSEANNVKIGDNDGEFFENNYEIGKILKNLKLK